jgi:hypothetical protein
VFSLKRPISWCLLAMQIKSYQSGCFDFHCDAIPYLRCHSLSNKKVFHFLLPYVRWRANKTTIRTRSVSVSRIRIGILLLDGKPLNGPTPCVARWYIFQTKNPNLGKFWKVFQFKKLEFLAKFCLF